MTTVKSKYISELFPFSRFSSKDYKSIIEEKLYKAEQDLQSIIYQNAPPTFENTILRLENNAHIYNQFVDAFFNLNSACTDEVIQNDAHEIAQKLSAFKNSILLNEDLFKRISAVMDNAEEYRQELDPESCKLLLETFEDFKRNGALLDSLQKERIKEIDDELAQIELKFADNVLADMNEMYIHAMDKTLLSGLNEDLIEMYKANAKKRNLDGYVISLQYPDYVPFMKYCSNRDLRKEIYELYMSRGNKDNQYNNCEIIKSIVSLKAERATILGFESHAQFILEKRMAHSVRGVEEFLNELLEKALPFAQKDILELSDVGNRFGIQEIMAYDHAYLAEVLRKEKFDYSDEDLKPYFELNSCVNAVFNLSKELYGLEFVKVENVDVYHPEVDVYQVLENGLHKAFLYTDFFPRDNKKAGAWMTVFKNQYKENGVNNRPHISIVCNFTPKNQEGVALLSFDELCTLFHEFGHALHGILADTTYASMSGTNVFWDFVELPSQFMENFCYNKKFLQSWSRHHKTGHTIPDALVDKLIASNQFMEAYQTVRQVSFGILDLSYYTQRILEGNISDFERNVLNKTQLYPQIDGASLSTSFAHIFGGGYDAGYYSYKWSEVLDADAYAYIKNENFSEEVIYKFKNLLSLGGTIDPLELFINFRGKPADISSLLDRSGII